MAETSTTKLGHIKKDIISELPRNIQETILGFLPIRDAVRTSILSRKWRHCWTMIPHIIFDFEFVYNIMEKLSQYHDPELKAHKFVSVINKVLLLHNGSICKFVLRFLEDCDAQIIHEYVDQWIPLLTRKGIKQLTLEDSELGEFTAHHFCSLDLTHLKLISVWFPFPCTPTCGGFTYLTKLKLIDVTNLEQSILDCPVLEKLTLIVCQGLCTTNFRAPNLKCLHQISYELNSEYSIAKLENLTEYSFGLLGYLTTQTKTSNLVKVLSSLHKIEKFFITCDFIQYLGAGGSPNRLSKLLPYLKTLNISDISFIELSEVSCLLCLIRSAPNLCKLNISADISQDAVEGNLKNYWIEDHEDCTLDHLEIVTFSYFRGLRAELELVKFLLGHSPMLKTMSIYIWNKSVTEEEVLQYSRASPRAQIKHLEHPVDFDDFGDFVIYN